CSTRTAATVHLSSMPSSPSALTTANREGAPLNWCRAEAEQAARNPSADAVAGNRGALSWVSGGSGNGRPKPSECLEYRAYKEIVTMMQAAKDSIDLGIICGDIHASLHFYHDLLGLTKVGVSEATTGTMHRLRFGTSDVKLIDPTYRPGLGPI